MEVPVHGTLNIFTLTCNLISFMPIKHYTAESCTEGMGKVIYPLAALEAFTFLLGRAISLYLDLS